MRFAVGDPRDRLRDIASTVTRHGEHCVVWSWLEYSIWAVDTEQLADNLHLHSSWEIGYRGKSVLDVSFVSRPPPQIQDNEYSLGCYDLLEYSREFRALRLYKTCDACEPVELQLQRSRF